MVCFKDRKWISKTAYCISCSLVCNIVFCSEFPSIRITLAEKQQEEERRQLQSVMRFTQTHIYLSSCLWEAVVQEYFQKKFVLRSSHQDVFFNIVVLHLWWNSLKNTGNRVQFLVNSHVTLTNFEPLLAKSYLSSHHQLIPNNYFCRPSLESCHCV